MSKEVVPIAIISSYFSFYNRVIVIDVYYDYKSTNSQYSLHRMCAFFLLDSGFYIVLGFPMSKTLKRGAGRLGRLCTSFP